MQGEGGKVRILWAQHEAETKILTFTFDEEPGDIDVGQATNVIYTIEGTSARLNIKNSTTDTSLELLNVFPNPVHDILQLEWKGFESEEAQIKVYDMFGRLIKSTGTGSFDSSVSVAKINVEDLKPGATYFIKINQGGAYCTGSFVKH